MLVPLVATTILVAWKGEGSAARSAGKPGSKPSAEVLQAGRKVYTTFCAPCHRPDGEGVPDTFPPLARADHLNADTRRAIDIVLNGVSGPMVVNGSQYDSSMPSWGLSDAEVAEVLTFVYSQWGNSGAVVTAEDVERVRKTSKPSEASR